MKLKLKDLREAQGLTKEQLHNLTGLSRQTLHKLEKLGSTGDLRSIQFSTIDALCNALKVPPGALFEHYPK